MYNVHDCGVYILQIGVSTPIMLFNMDLIDRVDEALMRSLRLSGDPLAVQRIPFTMAVAFFTVATYLRRIDIARGIAPTPAHHDQMMATCRPLAHRTYLPASKASSAKLSGFIWVLIANITMRDGHGIYIS